MHALATLSLPPHPSWSHALLAGLRHHLDTRACGSDRHSGLGPEELSSALQSIAKLGIQPSASWLESAERALLGMLGVGAGSVTRARGRLFGGAGEVTAGQGASQHAQQQGALSQSPHVLGARQLAGALYGLARLRHPASETLLDTASGRLLQLVGCDGAVAAAAAAAHSEEAVADPTRAVTENGGCDGTVTDTVGCDSASLRHVDVAQGLWALAMMGYTPDGDRLVQLAKAANHQLPAMGHAELAQVTWALQRMGLDQPPSGWLERLVGAIEPQLPRMPLLSLATLLRALAVWSMPTAVTATTAAVTTTVPAAAVQPPTASLLSPAWLAAASAAVERGAREVTATSNAAAAVAAGPSAVTHDLLSPPSVHSTVSSLSIDGASGSDGGAALENLAGPVRGVGAATAAPFTAVAARNATLAAAGVSLGALASARRLAAAERLPTLQRAKVTDAARRALAVLSSAAAAAAAATGPASMAHPQGGRRPAAGTASSGAAVAGAVAGAPARPPRLGPAGSPNAGAGGAGVGAVGEGVHGARMSTPVQPGGSGGAQPGQPGMQPGFESVYAECDLRFMPW